jgi:hypothetical protein
MKVLFFAAALFAGASAFAHDTTPNPGTGLHYCMSYIHTARPGVNYNFPYGPGFESLQDAKAEAFKRCYNDPFTTSWKMLCSTHCEQQ